MQQNSNYSGGGGGQRHYQQRNQNFHGRHNDFRNENGGNHRGGYQGGGGNRGGFTGIRPPNNFRGGRGGDHGGRGQHHQNNRGRHHSNQGGGYHNQQQQMPYYNQQHQYQFQQPQYNAGGLNAGQLAQQFQNLQYQLNLSQNLGSSLGQSLGQLGQQPQFPDAASSFLFNQQSNNSGDQLSALKLQEIAGLPNLANPPLPQSMNSSKPEAKAPTKEEKYDNLFSSDDENERRMKEKKAKASRSRDDPRMAHKNRSEQHQPAKSAPPERDDRPQKISASHNLYRQNDEKETRQQRNNDKEREHSPQQYNSNQFSLQSPPAPFIQWKVNGPKAQNGGGAFAFQRIKAFSSNTSQSPSTSSPTKFQLSTEQSDYLKQICKKVVAQRENKDKRERDDKQKRNKDANLEESKKGLKSVTQRVYEAKTIAEYFYLLNETNWNKFDDRFYLINRRWFDRWKDYIAFDYIVKQIIEQGKSESDLSINRVLQNNSNPNEVSNTQLLLEHREFVRNRSDRHHYCNFPLKKDIVPDRDLIFVTEPIWKFFKERYGGEEIKRFAVYKNPANVLDRSPFLPIVTMCLVIYDESIRSPKNLVMPRKMRFSYLKTLVKDALSWLKDIPNDNVRLWRLHPHLSHQDFIEQYNTQFEAGKLPELLKFPGLSLENSLDFYVEEYGNINLNKHVIFVEVKRPKGQWVFQLEPTDPTMYDEGAIDFQHHRSIYSHAAPEKGFYSMFFKFHNNTTKDFSEVMDDSKMAVWMRDPSKTDLVAWMPEGTKLQSYFLPEHIYFEVFQQMAHNFGQSSLQTIRQHLELPGPDTVSHSILLENKDSMQIANPNISRDSLRKKKRSPSSEKEDAQQSLLGKSQTSTVVSIQKHAVCNSCGTKTPLNQVCFCQACQQTPYCSTRCRTKDIRFHEVDCEPQDIIQAADDSKMNFAAKNAAKFNVSSDSDDKDSEDNSLILEILKSRIEREVIEELNQNLFSKRARKREKQRRICDDSDESDFAAEGTKKRQQKQETKLVKKVSSSIKKSQDTTGPTSETMTSQKAQMSQAEKKEKKKRLGEPEPLICVRPIKSLDSSLQQLAALLVMITQITPLRDSVMETRLMETDPLCSGLRDVFQQLITSSESSEPFSLVKNPLPHHLTNLRSLSAMYESLCRQLAKDNSQMDYSLISTLNQVFVCLSCGNRNSEESSLPVLQMAHESEESSKITSVKLKIIYLFDDDNYKKYELRLKPGEYTFLDINSKIKDLIQEDRMNIKLGKRSFILVDLFENLAFSSQIINEQMKFSFSANQQLTTFAYEIMAGHKQKIKKYHFVHIGKRKLDDSDPNSIGKIEYFSFPRLIVFGEQDRLSDIAQKMLKTLKNLLLNSGLDCSGYDVNSKDAYQQYFRQGQKNLFDILLVLKDGQRWRLDPSVHPSKKLLNTVDLDSVIRVECVMAPEAQLEDVRNSYIKYIEEDVVQEEEQTVVEVISCISKMCKQTVIEPTEMVKACIGCGKKAGLQKSVEIGRLSQYVGIVVDKSDPATRINYAPDLTLDKFIKGQKAVGQALTTTGLELVALVCQSAVKETVTNAVWLKHEDETTWTKHIVGAEPHRETLTSEDITSDPSIKFALYRKEIC